MKSRQIVLASRPHGLPSFENFRIEEKDLNKISEGEVLLKSWFISVDPYMRGRMNDVKSYAPSFQVDQPIGGGVVAKVIESRSKSFIEGDTVFGMLPWATYCIEKAENLRKVDTQSSSPSYYLGTLGMPGLTAYFGMMDIGKPKAGETVVVSGAAGAVGIVAGQISEYNNTEAQMGPSILPKLLTRSVLLQGFIVSNYSDRFGEVFAHLAQWINEGKLKYKETIIHGFDKLPDTFLALFSGKNQGKMLVETE
jgi:NADPH-dependent curcumin reductase CurA